MGRRTLIAFCLALAGCAELRGPPEHVVMFNASGQAVEPKVPRTWFSEPDLIENGREDDPMPTGPWGDYLDSMFKQASESGDATGHRRLVVFIHGGLNSRRDTIERANYLLPLMTQDGCYPIFVNWRSSLISSYVEHLLFLRQGENWGWWGSLLAPFFLVYDTTKAVILSPFIAVQEIGRWVGTNPGYDSQEQNDADHVADVLVNNWKQWNAGSKDAPPPTAILRGHDQRTWLETAGSVTAMTLTIPFKLVSGPFVVAMGSPAWDVMSRRVHLLLDSPPSSARGPDTPPHVPIDLPPTPPTQLLQFVARLARFQREEAAANKPWTIDLIGHSMGTMVANGILATDARAKPGAPFDVPEFERVVYMAAACSLRDLEASVPNYLLRHPTTDFYQLMLQDKAEDGERNAYDLSPRGSLLDWVDDFLSHPLAPMDQTAGRFRNFILDFEHMRVDLRNRIHVIEYGFADALERDEPQKHGQFGDQPFWRPEFFDPAIAQHPVQR